MTRRVLIFLLFLFLGTATAGVSIYALGILPIRFDHQILQYFGVKKPQIVGFLPYWLLTKADKEYSKYVTTMTYFGVTIDHDGSIMTHINPQEEEPGWTNLTSKDLTQILTAAKKSNLKTSLLVFGSDYSVIGELLNNPEASAKNLVAEVAPIMREKGFDDLNLDFETFMEASESARHQFTAFVNTVKKEIALQNLGTLTIDLIPISMFKNHLVDFQAIGAIVDTVVLMTYDYHYLASTVAGAIAPVGGAGETIEFDVETAVREALKVIPGEKILLGIPLYGYQWETITGSPGSATIPGGGTTASTRRVAEILKACATCSAQMDPVSREPYLIYPENDYYKQAYYENEESLAGKLALARKYRLGGVALWALGYEDDRMLAPLESYKKSFAVE